MKVEELGIKVIAVITDNSSINRKTMSLLASPPKLDVVYQHTGESTVLCCRYRAPTKVPAK